METDHDQSPRVLVIELFAEDDQWYVRVLGQGAPERYSLTPFTLILRLWPVPNSNATRGSLQLKGDEHLVGFQYNNQLAALVRTWLTGATSG